MVADRPSMRRWLAAFALLGLSIASAAHAQVRQTQSGPVQGITGFGITQFRGIPYAAPPVGSLRWRPPQAPLTWTGTRDASTYGTPCEQGPAPYPVSEDCLFLNIYEPASTTPSSRLPVMVWIHGGSFIAGTGSDYDGTALALRGNLIVVSINYRLGYLGFLAHPALSAQDPNHVSGNYGILDQQAAFAWVRRNIANFGGNPSLITIFGESAGGQSVVDQLVSPTAGPLAGAIVESGAYADLPTLAQSETAGETAATNLGCPDQTAACLYALDAAKIAAATNPLTNAGGVSPVVDGITLPLSPPIAFAKGKFQRIPVINGSNHDEYRLFIGIFEGLDHTAPLTADQYVAQVSSQFGSLAASVLTQYPAKKYAKPDYAYAAVITDVAFACNTPLLNALMAHYTQVYQYELADPNAPIANGPALADFAYGSAHSADISDFFPAYHVPFFSPNGPPPFTKLQQRLRDNMQDLWIRMARYGNPNGITNFPIWPPFSGASQAVLQFTPPFGAVIHSFSAEHHCAFWAPILRRQAGLP
jgi:para-nitrobenzyl esterase